MARRTFGERSKDFGPGLDRNPTFKLSSNPFKRESKARARCEMERISAGKFSFDRRGCEALVSAIAQEAAPVSPERSP